MAVTTDILASYRRPGHVMAEKLASGIDDRVAFAYLALGSVLGFVAQLPRLMREAREPNPAFEAAIRAEADDVRKIESLDVPANMIDAKFEALMSAALMGWIFIFPLILYVLAWVSQLALRILRGKANGLGSRVALFWAFLAATPVLLLQGLVAGFIGPGPGLYAVSAIWAVVFFWIWAAGLRQAGWGSQCTASR